MGVSSEREAYLASLEPSMQEKAPAAGRALLGTGFGFLPGGSLSLFGGEFALLFSEKTFPVCDRCRSVAAVEFLEAGVRPARIRELAADGEEPVYRYTFTCDCGADVVEARFPLIAGRFLQDRQRPLSVRYPERETGGASVGESQESDSAEGAEDPGRRTARV